METLAGHSHQMENRDTVGQASHDTIDGRELPHAVGRGEDRCAADAGVAVGGIGGIEFVGADNPLEGGNLLHGIVDGEGVVAWNSKDLVDAKLGEACQNIFSNGGSFQRNSARMASGMLSYNLDLAIPMEGEP